MKDNLLWVYQQITKSQRAALLEELRAQANVPVAILFYHRVADSHESPWSLSCDNFCRHLDWLQEHFEVVSLHQAQQRLASGNNATPTVAITFDDGYADNADFAIPQLISRGLTATYFVATHFVESGQPFPHDAAAGTPLRPNTIDQLIDFAEQGIEIGAHTNTHADLGRIHCREQMEQEIISSTHKLEGWLNREIRYFSFPYGLPENTSQLAVDVAMEYGFLGFCTAYGAWNWPQATPDRPSGAVHLRRIHADPGLERLKNWLTLDPRKLRDNHQLPFRISAQPQVAQIYPPEPVQ